MAIVLGILVMIIGLGVISFNNESNDPKNWVSVCGYLVILLGLAIICGKYF